MKPTPLLMAHTTRVPPSLRKTNNIMQRKTLLRSNVSRLPVRASTIVSKKRNCASPSGFERSSHTSPKPNSQSLQQAHSNLICLSQILSKFPVQVLTVVENLSSASSQRVSGWPARRDPFSGTQSITNLDHR